MESINEQNIIESNVEQNDAIIDNESNCDKHQNDLERVPQMISSVIEENAIQTETDGQMISSSSSTSSAQESRMSCLRQRVTYLGSAAINAPRSESEIQRNMAILNDSPSAMDITLVVPKFPEECVQMLELADNEDQEERQKMIGQFPISRIIFCARGKQESNERNCLAFTASHGSTFESGVIQCHVFRCGSTEVVASILQAFGLAFRRVTPTNSTQEFTVIVESGLEIKEDTIDGKTIICPRDKECFKFKTNTGKKICIAIFQDMTQSRVNLNIEKCFGMLLSPGRNIKHSEMIPIGLLSMTRHQVPSDNTRKATTQWQIIGVWNPNEPLFEVLNTETSRDTRVYFTIAVDLIVTGIREPIRFVFEAKAKIVGGSASDKFWYSIPSLSKGKPMQEQFHVQLREKANSEPDSRFEVITCLSATQLAHQRHKLALRMRRDSQIGDRMDSHRGSVSSLPTPSNDEDEDNDEPLPSGTGVVSKECTQSELDGWSDLLSKWHSNLSIRPRNVQTLVRRGIPEALRGEVWQLLAGCQDETSLMEQYKVLITRESPFEKYIERDINRTFPAHEYFKESGSLGQDSLFKLCKAYSNYDTEIGYCQGLSFLIAALLLHMPEEQAFCVVVKIMNDYGLRNLFRCGFEELHSKFYQLERAMDDLMPELYSHFADLGVEAHMYASQWFLTLFTAKFPLHVVFPILDLFLLDRMDTIFQVALALLSISKKDLLALDFEGVLKYFRVSLPKKFRTEENGKLLLRTAVAVKVKKLKKYEKEYQIWKESTKVENPVDRLEKENKRLNESAMRLEQENDDLAQELIITCNSKIRLRSDLDIVEDKAETLNSELLTTRSLLVDVEDEKKRLEDEVKCLKEMCRRELERAETEIERNTKIITEYKQICSQLQSRFESEQSSSRDTLKNILEKVNSCERCAKLFNSNHNNNEINGDNSQHNTDFLKTGPNLLQQKVEDLETELVKAKVALVEAECRNEELILQLNTAQTELNHMKIQNDESKNTWLSKTFSSIREAAKPKPIDSNLSRENSRDFTN